MMVGVVFLFYAIINGGDDGCFLVAREPPYGCECYGICFSRSVACRLSFWCFRSFIDVLVSVGCAAGALMFGYAWLDWVVQVQPVTWAAVVGCPCGIHPHLNPLPSRRPLKNCLFQDFDGFQGLFRASEGFSNVWKRPPDASFRRRRRVSEAAARLDTLS